MAFLGCKSLNFWIKHLKFCMQVPKCKTRPYTRAEVACGWAGAAKKLKKLSGTDRQTDGPTDGQSGS